MHVCRKDLPVDIVEQFEKYVSAIKWSFITCMFESSKLLEIFFWFVLIWNYCLWSWFPTCRAYYSMLVSMLESSNCSESLVNVSAHLFIINRYWTNYSVTIYDQKSSEGCPIESIIFVFNEDSVLSGDFFGNICD